jgi:myo-inositol-1(or 4)-monophosphatase
MERQEILDTALRAARAAVEVHRTHLGAVPVAEWALKGAADFVSHVDLEAERRIVECVRTAFPGHRILAEEGGASDWDAGADAPTWIIDPLDGTTNYLHRYPAYAVSIGFVAGGEPVVGVIMSGASGETWSAVAGHGAFHDGERIRVSTVETLGNALIGTGFPFRTPQLLPEYTRGFEYVLRRSAGVRRAGSAALDLCHVASGYFDGFWELALAPWDVAAGTLIVREAGGIVTRLNGAAQVLGHGSILAGNPGIHRALGHALAAAAQARDETNGEAAAEER